MDSKEIVRRLVVGSDAIDRMKREIDSVVATVIGLVTKEHEINSWHGEFSRKYRMERFSSSEFPGCRWHLHSTDGQYPFHVSYYLNIGPREARVFSCGWDNTDIPQRYARRVHESLPIFLDGMKKVFPFLEDRWQLILDAADYAEKNGW